MQSGLNLASRPVDNGKPYELFIANRWRPAGNGRSIASVNPDSEEAWTAFAAATAEDVDAAVQAAHDAFENGPWRRMAPRERGMALRRIADRIPAASEHLGHVETTDTGKLLRETTWQARNIAEVFNFYAEPHRYDCRHYCPIGIRSADWHGAARADRRCRCDRAVEFPIALIRLQGRSGARRRLHGSIEALRAGLRRRARAGPDHRRGRPAPGRVQRGHRRGSSMR